MEIQCIYESKDFDEIIYAISRGKGVCVSVCVCVCVCVGGGYTATWAALPLYKIGVKCNVVGYC